MSKVILLLIAGLIVGYLIGGLSFVDCSQCDSATTPPEYQNYKAIELYSVFEAERPLFTIQYRPTFELTR